MSDSVRVENLKSIMNFAVSARKSLLEIASGDQAIVNEAIAKAKDIALLDKRSYVTETDVENEIYDLVDAKDIEETENNCAYGLSPEEEAEAQTALGLGIKRFG